MYGMYLFYLSHSPIIYNIHMPLINLADYEEAAREKMDAAAYDYYAGGADDEITLKENASAYGKLRLYHRALRGLKGADTRITLLGQELATPIFIAPTAMQRLAHPDGELAMVRAAGKAGALMMLSSLSTYSLEEVRAAAGGPLWFQLYVFKDEGMTKDLIQRAEAAGYAAVAVTVDVPAQGNRERDVRNQFHLPPGMTLANFSGLAAKMEMGEGSALGRYITEQWKLDLSWEDFERLAGMTKLPVLVKGISHPEDAKMAVEHGAVGVVVSNHGGRQLDTAIPTIEALPDVAAAITGKAAVLVDGGVRRGTDVVKALALGADAVGIGRPALWGLAVDGEAGVSAALGILQNELERTMVMCGAGSVGEITEATIR